MAELEAPKLFTDPIQDEERPAAERPATLRVMREDADRGVEHPLGGATPGEMIAAAERIEKTLVEIRNRLDRTQRENQYGEFSAGRFIGAFAQVFAFCFLVWGLSDLYFQTAKDVLLTKLGFAAVAQLGALTAFVVARGDRREP